MRTDLDRSENPTSCRTSLSDRSKVDDELDTLEGTLARLDKKRGLVSSALVFGMLVTLISKENSVRFCFRLWQAKSEAAPATVGGESLLDMPLGFLDKAREGEQGL